jgi:8-oxo-dGTP pyrophosphatase MutT (NUDIX family)
MNFEPQKFYIGLIDFFSIFLPGALLTYLLKDNLGPSIIGKHYGCFTEAEGWIVFLFNSYLIGHFIFLLGSWLLDDQLYDPLRNATYQGQIKRLSKGDTLSVSIFRVLAKRLIKNDADKTLNLAVVIKEYYLDQLKAASAINAFQWSKARLTFEQPAAIATVQRFEADSKFFRSFLIVLFILILWGLRYGPPAIALVSVLLLPLAFWRYIEQRVKATSQAYYYIITMEAQREGGYRHPIPIQSHGPSHAGGIVFRLVGDKIEYLLVRAKNNPQEWVIPKGHIEPGEDMRETAVREVREETGVWARILSELEMSSYTINGSTVEVQLFLMETLEEGKPSERREYAWFPISEAITRVIHQESKDLLKQAEHKRTTIVGPCRT